MPAFITVLVMALASCANSQSEKPTKLALSPQEFTEKIKSLSDAPVIDVRTPKEFAEGAIDKAINVNWKDAGFAQQIEAYDKDKPVFVYCLLGGRSGEAAAMMRDKGFKEVYELEGGVMKWNAAGLPLSNASASQGMSISDYDKLLASEKLVLVDFYAEWCGPCKKMKPYLEEISTEMKDKVEVVRIDADENKALCKEMDVTSLPVLILYKEGNIVWTKRAMAEKAEMIAAIEAALK